MVIFWNFCDIFFYFVWVVFNVFIGFCLGWKWVGGIIFCFVRILIYLVFKLLKFLFFWFSLLNMWCICDLGRCKVFRMGIFDNIRCFICWVVFYFFLNFIWYCLGVNLLIFWFMIWKFFFNFLKMFCLVVGVVFILFVLI